MLTQTEFRARGVPSLPGRRTSGEWIVYFRGNSTRLLPIEWERGALTADEGRLIGSSLQIFQQGESQEGGHFFRCASAYAKASGDFAYAEAHRLFMAEEKRHGRDLARFLALLNVPVLTRLSALARGFCWFGSRGGLEPTLLVILMSEICAEVYYSALRQATASPVLRQLCTQILRDEKMHVRFQSERLAILRTGRPDGWLVLSHAVDVLLFLGAGLACWVGHRRVLRAAGLGFVGFWRKAWSRFRASARVKAPQARFAR